MKAQVKIKVIKKPEETGNDATDIIIGNSPVMQEVYKAIGRAAPTDATVLIRGRKRNRKRAIARAIFQHSLRSITLFR